MVPRVDHQAALGMASFICSLIDISPLVIVVIVRFEKPKEGVCGWALLKNFLIDSKRMNAMW